jgi:dihydropteroate synthase
MGILNVTPDSFSDGGLFFVKERAVAHALQMVKEGADIIDIGGESTRPGALIVNMEEELKRVIPVIQDIRKHSDIFLSIDTTKAEVAERALHCGANMINDISAGRFDPSILEVAAKAQAPICLMHMKGTPQDMQDKPVYDDLMMEIVAFLDEAVQRASAFGIDPKHIIIDPGIGFGKTVEDNFTILRKLDVLKILEKPILIGPSKKSFIGKNLELDINERLEPTLATISYAFKKGASVFRVHDVAPTRRYLKMVQLLN